MASPSPVPPNERATPASACSKALNTRACFDSAMPMPVSRTAKARTTPVAVAASASETSIAISPDGVNFIALPTMFTRIWRMRSASATTCSGTSGATRYVSSRPLRCAGSANICAVSATSSRTANGCGLSSSLPASIFEKSRMSLMMWSSASAEVLTISRYWRCSGGCGASSSSSVIPSTPFIGVRISWLMLATNSLLARLAFSAAVLASRSAAVCVRTRRRSVTIHASDTATRPARPATIHTTRAPVNHGAASITLMPDGPGDEQAEAARHGAVAGARRLHRGHAGDLDDAAEIEPRTRPARMLEQRRQRRRAGLDQEHVLVGADDVLAEHAADADQLAVELVLQQILARQQVRLGQRGAADALHHRVLERRRVVARLREADDFDDVARA